MNHLPNKHLFYLLVLLVGAFTFGSCKKPSDASNIIKGDIYDANGNKFKISGAEVVIHIYGTGNIGQSDPMYNVTMDANSHYEISVPNNVYAVHARAFMNLGGRRVAIDLKPLDGKPDNINLPSAPGIVRDFALQLSGPVPGGDPNTIQGYYGAKVWFGDGKYNFTSTGYWDNLAAKYPGGVIHFFLTPMTPLIDGTTGQVLELTASVDNVKTGKWFASIPYAVYKVQAVLVTANGTQIGLYVSAIPGNLNTVYPSIDLDFPPDPTDPFGRPSKAQVALWE